MLICDRPPPLVLSKDRNGAIVNFVAGACGPAKPEPQAGFGQSSTSSEMLGASSTSIPRYPTVLSSFVWPSSSYTDLKLPVLL